MGVMVMITRATFNVKSLRDVNLDDIKYSDHNQEQ